MDRPSSSNQVFALVAELIDNAQKILVIQADNPDADSLGSALALEQILGELGKNVYLYCGVEVPTYLRYTEGWSRVATTLPSQFDLSIIVDTSTNTLLQKMNDADQHQWLATKPCLVLDHHLETDNSIAYASLVINRPDLSSTGELIYLLAKVLNWPIDQKAGEAITTAILGDTQGLTNESASAATYRVIADLIDLGVNRPKLEELRRLMSKMDQKIFRYKATLIDRTELHANNRIALVTIPQEEINTYSPLYNPAPLIQSDMLQIADVRVALVLKHYDDGKILGSIRCNNGAPIAATLAAKFGGGGHAHAAGFKITDGTTIKDIASQCIVICTELLDSIAPNEDNHETIQYSF